MPTFLHIAYITARVVAAAIGCTLLFASCAIYKSESGALQSRLEDLWCEIDDQAKGALSRQELLLQTSATKLRNRLDSYLDEGFTMRSFVSVGSFSIACAVCYAGFGTTSWLSNVQGLLLCGAFLKVSYSAAKRKRAYAVEFICGILLLAGSLFTSRYQQQLGLLWRTLTPFQISEIVLIVGVVGGFLSLSLLLLIRRITRKISEKASAFWTFNACTVMLLMSIAVWWLLSLFGFPHPTARGFGAYTVYYYGWHALVPRFGFGIVRYVLIPATFGLLYVAFCLIMPLLVSACLFALLFAMVVHLLFWPLARRSIYGLCEWKILDDRTKQFVVGSTLVLFAFPKLASLVK